MITFSLAGVRPVRLLTSPKVLILNALLVAGTAAHLLTAPGTVCGAGDTTQPPVVNQSCVAGYGPTDAASNSIVGPVCQDASILVGVNLAGTVKRRNPAWLDAILEPLANLFLLEPDLLF